MTHGLDQNIITVTVNGQSVSLLQDARGGISVIASDGVATVLPSALPAHKHAWGETVAKFIAWGKVQGRKDGKPWDEQHTKNVAYSLAGWLNIKNIEDMTAAVFEERMMMLRGLKKQVKRWDGTYELTDKPRYSTKTLWHIATHVKTFMHWCVAQDLLQRDPLRNCRKPSGENTKKCRVLYYGEFQLLRAAACKNKRPETALVYLVAAQTGFRQGELRALKVRDLEAKRMLLHLSKEDEKTRVERWFPLTPKLAARLKAASSGKSPDEPLLQLTHSPIHEFNKDLAKAGKTGIPKETPEGVIDFHGLRRTGATWISEAGASDALKHAWLRHSDRQTSDRYAIPLQKDLRRVMLKVENNLERRIVLGLEENGGYRDRTGDLQTASLSEIKSLCLHVLAYLEASDDQRARSLEELRGEIPV